MLDEGEIRVGDYAWRVDRRNMGDPEKQGSVIDLFRDDGRMVVEVPPGTQDHEIAGSIRRVRYRQVYGTHLGDVSFHRPTGEMDALEWDNGERNEFVRFMGDLRTVSDSELVGLLPPPVK